MGLAFFINSLFDRSYDDYRSDGSRPSSSQARVDGPDGGTPRRD